MADYDDAKGIQLYIQNRMYLYEAGGVNLMRYYLIFGYDIFQKKARTDPVHGPDVGPNPSMTPMTLIGSKAR